MDSRNQLARLGTKVLGAVAFVSLMSCQSLSGQLVGDGVSFGPEARVNVTGLSDAGENFVLPVDSEGKFELNEELESDTVMVEALVPGFRAVSVRVNVNEVSEIKLPMQPLPKIQTSPLSTNLDGESDRGSGGVLLNPPKL